MQKHKKIEVLFACAIVWAVFFVVNPFVEPMAWSLLVAAGTWPVYERTRSYFGPKIAGLFPFLFTIAVCSLLVAPIFSSIGVVAEKVPLIGQRVLAIQSKFGEVPPALSKLPYIGKTISSHWHIITHPDLSKSLTLDGTKGVLSIGESIARFAGSFAIFVLSLVYIYSQGETIIEKGIAAVRRSFGERVERLVVIAWMAISANMRGGAVLALVEGAILTAILGVSGYSYPFVVGFLCGMLSPVPLAAPALISVATIQMIIDGNFWGGVSTGISGGIIMFVADPIIRSRFGNRDTKLPFLAGIIGMFGGASAFGLIGLFIGPAILSVGLSVWKTWTE